MIATKSARWLLVISVITLLSACADLDNYLTPVYQGPETETPARQLVKVLLTNYKDLDISQIWTIDTPGSDWRLLADNSANPSQPLLSKGQSIVLHVYPGDNKVKVVMMDGTSVWGPMSVGPQGAVFGVGSPPPKPQPKVAAAPPPAPASAAPAAKPTPAPAPSAAPARDAPPAQPKGATDAKFAGTYESRHITNSLYGNVNWHTITFLDANTLRWEWMQDNSHANANVRDDSMPCHWHKFVFKMSYTNNGDGSIAMQCVDKKEYFCTGRIKQRGCFKYPITVKRSAEGLQVGDGDRDGTYFPKTGQ